ncbi:MAG: ribosome small subunit-dependent GTPase A [Nitrospinae bacterium]|nr:ribosome small subunit-dependent GTPase A [Nitrospinota bacterium]
MLLPPPSGSSAPIGRVVVHLGARVRALTANGEVELIPPKKESWVVGDLLRLEPGRPPKLIERVNMLSRSAVHGGKQQILAANLDWLIVVAAPGDALKTGLVDRFLVAASHAGIHAMIALNKIDLPGAGEAINELAVYRAYGYQVHPISANTGEGIESFAAAIGQGVCALVGHSGVGKSSIFNRLAPEANRATREIHHESGRGRHTTSVSLMAPLPGGGGLIDAPGVRQFVPSGLEPRDVADHFPGFGPHMGGCKFRDCLHLTETGCAIRRAVDAGALDSARYQSYQRLLESSRESAPKW